jgi:hypothetical protein
MMGRRVPRAGWPARGVARRPAPRARPSSHASVVELLSRPPAYFR